jgi:tetrahydromethanopterin S-methyltransferase subunit D
MVTNFLGALLGMLLFYAFKKIRFTKVHNVCAIALVCLASIMTVIAVYTVATNIEGYLYVLLRKG